MKRFISIAIGASFGLVLAVGLSVGLPALAQNVAKRFQGTVVADRFNGAKLAIAGTDITSTAAELNANDITAAGTAEGSKVMVLSSAKTIATVNQITVGNYYRNSTTASASADIATATLHFYQLWKVDTTSGAVDLDFGEDVALSASDIGNTWRFLVVTGGTNALTVTAGTTVSTVATSQAGAGATCEDAGDYLDCMPYTTTAVRCQSFCAD